MSSDRLEITAISWGRMELRHQDEELVFKDCKVWPEGAKEWDWSITGTRHVPGIQPSDIQELLEHEVELIILSRGMQLVLQTCPETVDFLKTEGIDHRIEETTAAVALFNE